MEENFNKIVIGIERIPIYTLKGKKEIIKLSDFVYGEWLVFKLNRPFFYINIFDPDLAMLKKNIESKKITIEGLIKKMNLGSHECFSLEQNYFGIKNYNKTKYQKIEVTKLPLFILNEIESVK